MAKRDKKVGASDVPPKPTTDDNNSDGFFWARPKEYWDALRIVADEHRINPKLRAGASDEIYYLVLAKAFLSEAIGEDPQNIEMAAAAIAARAAINTYLRPQARSNPDTAVMYKAVKKAIAVAASGWKHSGIPLPGPGRPHGSYDRPIVALMRKALITKERGIDLTLPWGKAWDRLLSYLHTTENQGLGNQYERDKNRRAMKGLLGANGEKARQVYRTLKKHQKELPYSPIPD